MKATEKIPYIKQPTRFSCGPAVLFMIFLFFKKKTSFEKLCEELSPHEKIGVSNKALVEAIKKRGLVVEVKGNSTLSDVRKYLKLDRPVIVNYIENVFDEGHYAIVSKLGRKYIHLLDPLHGKRFRLLHSEFEERWQSEYGGHKRWLAVVSNKPII